MSKLMSELTKKKMTRRGFITALSSAAVLAGCSSGGEDEAIVIIGDDEGPEPELYADDVFPAGFQNNCGGSCLTYVHVRGRVVGADGKVINNGRIMRLTTDEHPEYNYIDGARFLEADMQKRACLRCRGKKHWLQHRNDRILYPLKQTGRRGDISGFKRIGWPQAIREIGEKLAAIKNAHGSEAITIAHSTGDTGEGQFMGQLRQILHGTGGFQNYKHSMSFSGFENTCKYVWGMDQLFPYWAGTEEMLRTDHIVFWSANDSEAIQGTNVTWMITQAKEMGVRISAVEQRASSQVTVYAKKDDRYYPYFGTDSAMMQAMMYHLIMLEWGGASPVSGMARPAAGWLNRDYIRKYIHGFFDTDDSDTLEDPYTIYVGANFWTPPKAYSKDVNLVAPGTSLSAYLLGDDDTLVQADINKATSVYPDSIGYNLRAPGTLSSDDPGDGAYGKRSPAYGQVPKTPEWAEKITGVSADRIRRLAEMIAGQKTVMITGLGYNRAFEAEQNTWNFQILAAVTRCWGEPGRRNALFTSNIPMTTYAGMPVTMRYIYAANTPDAAWATYNRIAGAKYDKNLMSADLRDYTDVLHPDYYKMNCSSSDNTVAIPLTYLQDVIQYGGSGKSKWNDPQTANGPTVRAILNLAGNSIMNQNPDLNMMRKVLTADDCNTEMIVTWDFFMTATAQYSDYILPAAMNLEKTKSFNKHSFGSSIIIAGKVFEPEGEARAEWDTWVEIAETMKQTDAAASDPQLYTPMMTIKGIRTNEELQEYFFEEFVRSETASYSRTKDLLLAGGKSVPYEQFKRKGFYYVSENYGGGLPFGSVPFEAFYNDPGGVGNGNALKTPSGRIEAYSRLMIEDYEARRYYNFDTDDGRYSAANAPYSFDLVTAKDKYGVGVTPQIVTRGCYFRIDSTGKYARDGSGNLIELDPITNAAEIQANAKRQRFAYPIPMYIPYIEGRHACENDSSVPAFNVTSPINKNISHGATQHPDVYGYKDKYPFNMISFHGWSRAHSTGNNSPLVNEVFKRDKDGKPAFLNPQRPSVFDVANVNAGEDGATIAPVWDDNIYEPVFVHPDTGIPHGEKVIIYNDRGAIYASAVHTLQVLPHIVMLAQGSWVKLDEDGVDVGGCINTLTTAKGSRIGQGNTVVGDNRVMIRKAADMTSEQIRALDCMRRTI